MQSKGVVNAEELSQQFGERLPGGFEAAARAMDMTTQQLRKATEQGEITASELFPRLSVELLKMANRGGQLQEAMQKTSAAINRFGNNVLLANYKFQEAGMDRGIRNLMNTMSDFIMRSDSLWKFLGQIGENIADSFRAVFELLGSLGERFKSFEELANSLGLEMDQLAGVLALFFKWGRKLLFIFWLLPGAISGVSKLLDGENLSWIEWGITIAGVALGLKGVHGWLKKLRGMKKPSFIPQKAETGTSNTTPRVSQRAVRSAQMVDDWTQTRSQSWLGRIGQSWKSGIFQDMMKSVRSGLSGRLPVIGMGVGSTMPEEDYLRMAEQRPFWDLTGRLQDFQNEQNRQMIVNGDIRFEIEGKDGPQIADEVIRTINENFIRPASINDPVTEK